MQKEIKLKGLRQNNLKNLDVVVPLRSFTVLCGPSGSGKSSLAFQTLFAEGQRRYLESISNYARQFIGQAQKPLLDKAENIPPSIALQQKNTIRSSRSNVGTYSEIYDYIRVLFARLGKVYCPNHNKEMKAYDSSLATKEIYKNFSEQRAYLLSPLKWSKSEEAKILQEKLVKKAFSKVLCLDNENKIIKNLDIEFDKLPARSKNHFVVIDRVLLDEESRGRVFDAISQSYELSKELQGNSESCLLTTTQEFLKFRKQTSCSLCSETFWDLSPELFSSHNPIGACESCQGFGNILDLDPYKVIPNQKLSIKQGAIYPFQMPSGKREKTKLNKFCKDKKISTETPWEDLKQKERDLIWEGDSSWSGIQGTFAKLEQKKYKMHVRVFLSRFKSARPCPSCKGDCLNPRVKQVKIEGKDIGQIISLSLEKLKEWILNLELTPEQEELTREVRNQITQRLEFLVQIGLSYLNLSRLTRTLSGGEFQRLNIAKQIGAELSDTLYVLDEPTIGLHPRDNSKLIELLNQLHQKNNTLVVVEHDQELIKNASYVIEMGPESGVRGGDIIFEGSYKNFFKSKTKTTEYLKGKKSSYRISERKINPKKIKLSSCTGHNLKSVDLEIPMENLTVVTGVSGSGKSSLITQSLYPALSKELTGERLLTELPYKSIKMDMPLDKVEYVDQSNLARNKRSNIATYTGCFDVIRKLFASEKKSKLLGFKPGSFSLNTEGGRCPSCKGLGVQEVNMLFMDNLELVCEDCSGKKYTSEILEIQHKGKNIYQILEMGCDEALDFFKEEKKIYNSLKVLAKLKLGHLKLGQSLSTLSGGESQRLKLSQYLKSSSLKKTLFIFDEPTTGLHFEEVLALIEVFNELVDSGATLVVIEHNLDVIASSDWIIDIGPEAGDQGGTILAQGEPLDFAKEKGYTAKYLKEHIAREL